MGEVPTDKIRTVIADDEGPARSRLLECVRRQADIDVVGIARDGREAVSLVRQHAPHLLFLDVEMPLLDGFGVLEELEFRRLPVTVFVTAYDKYAIQAFDAHAIDYLLKPFSDQRFEDALVQARKHVGVALLSGSDGRSPGVVQASSGIGQRSAYLERIVLRAGGRIRFLNIDDVDWIEAAGVYVHLHVGSKTHIYRSSLSSILERLDPKRFVRLHRSAVVNTVRIHELQPRSHGDFIVILRDGTELMMSRAYRSQLEGWLQQPL